jgi:hypothetical protein
MSGITMTHGADQTTQAHTNFIKSERATSGLPYKKYYANGNDVTSQVQNKFEGRGNYCHYFPAKNIREQQVEKIWFEARNKVLQEKRTNEEGSAMLKQWQDNRGRIEGEIARKKEHFHKASNFQEARGFVRRNWSSKGFKPDSNPLQELSSEEEDEYGEEDLDII